jgi:alanyl-tRNA synthetase
MVGGTGAGALVYLRKLEDELLKTGERLTASPFEAASRVDKLLAEEKTLAREIDKLKQRIASGGGGRDLLAEAVTIKGIKVLAAQVDVDDAAVLRSTGDQLRDKLGSGVVVLAGVGGPKVQLLAMVTKDLVGKLKAGDLLGQVAAALGGRGGGKPDMAQGSGGTDPTRVPAALEVARKWIESQT